MKSDITNMIEAVSALAGCSPSNVMLRIRRRPYPLCRYLIASTLLGMGMGVTEISRVMSMNHSTVAHGLKMVEDIRLGFGLPHEIEIVNEWLLKEYELCDNLLTFVNMLNNRRIYGTDIPNVIRRNGWQRGVGRVICSDGVHTVVRSKKLYEIK